VGYSVIPAKAGIQEKQALLDPGFRRGDGFGGFLQTHLSLIHQKPLCGKGGAK